MTDRSSPIVNTQNECGTLSRAIEISRREFADGKGIPNDEVFDRLHKKLLAMKAAQG